MKRWNADTPNRYIPVEKDVKDEAYSSSKSYLPAITTFENADGRPPANNRKGVEKRPGNHQAPIPAKTTGDTMKRGIRASQTLGKEGTNANPTTNGASGTVASASISSAGGKEPTTKDNPRAPTVVHNSGDDIVLFALEKNEPSL